MVSPDTTMLTDGVITLRPLDAKYAPVMTAAVLESLASLSPWMSWANPNYSEENHLEWTSMQRQLWERGLSYQFVVLDPGEETVLGGCGLNHVNSAARLGNLGYWVRASRRGEGIAPRATRLVARFAFEQLDLLRVEIVVAEENTASLRAAEKAGAHREGRLPNRMVVRDQVYEAIMHSLTPEDFGLKKPEIT